METESAAGITGIKRMPTGTAGSITENQTSGSAAMENKTPENKAAENSGGFSKEDLPGSEQEALSGDTEEYRTGDSDEDLVLKITECAERLFGITAVKPFQLLVMHRILEQDGGHVPCRGQIVILPTGTGKSLCFLVPAVLCRGLTVIVYPLLALMNDQLRKLEKAGVDCVCLRGGQTAEQRKRVFERLERGTKLLITDPEMLCVSRIIERLKKLEISLFVCDEAHVIEQWGRSFRPAYLELKRAVRELAPRQVLAFTATAGEQTMETIKNCLFETAVCPPVIVRGDADRENIFYCAYPALYRDMAVFEILRFCARPAIVFCRKRGETKKLCETGLRILRGMPQRYYHAGLEHQERERLEKWFLESKDGVLYATTAYGMGIDKPDIRTVIHHRLPQSAEQFLQEAGRAGRDREQAVSYAVVTEDERRRNIERQKNNERWKRTGKRQNNEKQKNKERRKSSEKQNNERQEDNERQKSTAALPDIFTGNVCRRKMLLASLGQEKEECTGCDVCAGQNNTRPWGLDVYLGLVKRHPFCFNAGRAAALLCGVRETGMVAEPDRINPYFGLLRGEDQDLVEKSLRRLVRNNEHPYRPLAETAGKVGLLYPCGNFLYTFYAGVLEKMNGLGKRIFGKDLPEKHFFRKHFGIKNANAE